MKVTTKAIIEREPVAKKNLNLLQRDLMLSDDCIQEFDKSFEITAGDLAAIKPIQLETEQSNWMDKTLKTYAVQQSNSKRSGIFEDDLKSDEISSIKIHTSKAAPKKVGVFAPNNISTPNPRKKERYIPKIEDISDCSDIDAAENADSAVGANERAVVIGEKNVVVIGEKNVVEIAEEFAGEIAEEESAVENALGDDSFSNYFDIEKERESNMKFVIELERFEKYRQSFLKSKLAKRTELIKKRNKYLKKLKLVDTALKEVHEVIEISEFKNLIH
jgi:hypothetical protein